MQYFYLLLFFALLSSFRPIAYANISYSDEQVLAHHQVLNDTCRYLQADARWTYRTAALSPPQQRKIEVKIIGDSLIGNRLCSVMGLYDSDVFVEGSELIIFYDLDHVYCYEQGGFKLLYDFSTGLLPGDTLSFHLPQNFAHYALYDYVGDGSLIQGRSFDYRIVGYSFLELPNGDSLKRYETIPLLADTVEIGYQYQYILEGIGSIFGFLGRPTSLLPSGPDAEFICYQSNSFSYVATSEGCDISSVWEPSFSDFQLYPNPADHWLYIRLDKPQEADIQQLEVLHFSGHRLQLQAGHQDRLDISQLPTGVYLLRLLSSDGKWGLRPFVKH